MKLKFLVFGLGFILSAVSPALAVQPASVDVSDNIAWSKVVENPFDGKIVYDRNYKDSFVFVSSWSKNGIGATYTRLSAALIGYQSDYGYRRRSFGWLFNDVPIYQEYAIERVPDSINLAINGKIYTYESGPVSPELAAALATAPPGKVKIRLLWKDGDIKDTEIGKDTVNAWRTVFSPS